MPRPTIVLRPGAGATLEEYWHYLIGYLLPAAGTLRAALGPWQDATPARTIVLHSCGPVMDGIARTVFAPTPDSVEFRDLRVRRRGGHAQRLQTFHTRLPRYPAVARVRSLAARDMWINVPRLDSSAWWWDPTLPVEADPITSDLGALNELLALSPTRDPEAVPGGRVLVLQRSAQPAFYNAGGGSLVPTYGRGRRWLANAPDVADALGRAGYDAVCFEPGRHPLPDQATAFAEATAIVGVRGAEFANLLWARPGTPVILMNPTFMAPPHSPALQLARYRGCRLTELPVEGREVVADPEAVVDALARVTA